MAAAGSPGMTSLDSKTAEGTFLTELGGGDAADANKGSLHDYEEEDVGELEALVAGVTQTTQSTLLLKKRKQMREVDDALEFMKEEFKLRMEVCDERQRDFDKKRKDMKEQVVKFEKFVRENDQKHKRAELKAKSERKLREQLEEKKKKCQDELQMCMKESERFEGSLRSLVRYKSYLDSVTESSSSDGEYEEIMDILQRYWTLRNANNDLQQQQNERTAELDAARKNNAETLQRLQQELLVRNSNIHGMQRKIESLRHESQKQGGEIELKEHVRKSVKKDCGQIVMSIKNLYNRCGSSGKTSKPPKIAFSEKTQQLAYMEACLSYIQDRVLDLSGVAAGYANQNQLNSASTASVPSSPTANATKF